MQQRWKLISIGVVKDHQCEIAYLFASKPTSKKSLLPMKRVRKKLGEINSSYFIGVLMGTL